MGTIAEKIGYLKETKNAIKNALIDKNVEVSDSDTFRSYADKISSIETGITPTGTIDITENGNYDVTNYANAKVLITNSEDMLQARVDETNSCNYLFYEYTGNNPNVVKNLDTSNVTNMSHMFYNCSRLTSLDLSNFNTSNVTDMNQMFRDCRNLTTLDLSSFDTSKVTNMTSMFYYCTKLETLNLSNFNISKITSMSSMFDNCNKLTTLDLSSFDTSHIKDTNQIFYLCAALTTIVGTLDLINCTNLSNMFYYCKALTTVTLKNIKKTLTIGSGTNYGTLLTDDTIINTFKELHDLTGSTAQTLTLSTPSGARTEEIYVKLIDVTDEMRAEDQYVDNKKPCIVCESTDEGAMTLKEYGISKNWNISY